MTVKVMGPKPFTQLAYHPSCMALYEWMDPVREMTEFRGQ